MSEKSGNPPEPEILDPRFYFSHYTPDRGCGGTDGDVFLQLLGDGVVYPGPGRWYVLDNSGNDRERGDYDTYWLESGSMKFVHTCRLYFVPSGDSPEWELASCSLNKMKKDPLTGMWQITQFINNWQYNRCLRQEGWYSKRSDGLEAASEYASAHQLFMTDPSTFDAAVRMVTLASQQDFMRITDKRAKTAQTCATVDRDVL